MTPNRGTWSSLLSLGPTWAALLILLSCLVASEKAQALPRYTAQYGQSCTLCLLP